MEHEYDDSLYEGWLQHAVTRKMVKESEKRLGHLVMRLETSARHSTDPDVREAITAVAAQRVMLAELRGQEQVGGQQ